MTQPRPRAGAAILKVKQKSMWQFRSASDTPATGRQQIGSMQFGLEATSSQKIARNPRQP
jgi:hypothetical protein